MFMLIIFEVTFSETQNFSRVHNTIVQELRGNSSQNISIPVRLFTFQTGALTEGRDFSYENGIRYFLSALFVDSLSCETQDTTLGNTDLYILEKVFSTRIKFIPFILLVSCIN